MDILTPQHLRMVIGMMMMMMAMNDDDECM